MKNLLVVAVTVGLGYLLWDAQPKPPPPPTPVAVVATPAPKAAPKLYFHSALDAPAMRTSAYTGTGYYSTESTSRFDAGYGSAGYGSSSTYVGGGPTIVMVPTGQPATSAGTVQLATSGLNAGIAQANQMMAQRVRVSHSGEVAVRKRMPTPAPVRAW